MILLSLFNSIDWKVLLGSITIAIAWPYFDLMARFCIPIISGIVWVFLKPKVMEWKEKYKGVNFFSLAWKSLVSFKGFISKIFK